MQNGNAPVAIFLSSWNGILFFYDENIQLFWDTAYSTGIGGYCRGEWFASALALELKSLDSDSMRYIPVIAAIFLISSHIPPALPSLDIMYIYNFITHAYSIKKILSSTIQTYMAEINFFVNSATGQQCPSVSFPRDNVDQRPAETGSLPHS